MTKKKTKNNKRVSFEIYRSMRLSMRAVKEKLSCDDGRTVGNLE